MWQVVVHKSSSRFPNLVQPKVSGLTIGIKRIEYIEITGFRKFRQFFLVKVMHVTETLSPAAPIEQIIPRIHLRRWNGGGFPGLDPPFELFTVQELPVGVDKDAFLSQQLLHVL